MDRPRFSIAVLLVAVILIGIGLEAFVNPSGLWNSLLYSAELMALHAAVVGLCVSRGRSRAFWLAFAVFGWGYFVLSSAPWLAEATRPRLVSDKLLLYLYPRIIRLPIGVDFKEEGYLVGDRTNLSSSDVFNRFQAGFRDFKDIGHSLTGIFLALGAGYVARLAGPKRDRPADESSRGLSDDLHHPGRSGDRPIP